MDYNKSIMRSNDALAEEAIIVRRVVILFSLHFIIIQSFLKLGDNVNL